MNRVSGEKHFVDLKLPRPEWGLNLQYPTSMQADLTTAPTKVHRKEFINKTNHVFVIKNIIDAIIWYITGQEIRIVGLVVCRTTRSTFQVVRKIF